MFRSSTGPSDVAKETILLIKKKKKEWYHETSQINWRMSFIEGVSKTVKREAKQQKQKWGFFSMLLGPLGASLLGNLLTGKGTIKTSEGTIRAGQDF